MCIQFHGNHQLQLLAGGGTTQLFHFIQNLFAFVGATITGNTKERDGNHPLD